MSNQIYGVGNVVAAEFDAVYVPHNARPNAATLPGVIMCHGAGSTEVDQPTWPTVSKLIHQLGEVGIPVGLALMGGDTYGNDAISGSAGTSYMNKMLAHMAATAGCSPTRAHVFGISMGAGVGTRWASLNQSKAASVIGAIPLSNVQYMYDNATVGGVDFRTSIQTAWGVTYPAALPSGTAGPDMIGVHAPRLAAANIPAKYFYTSDDPYIRPVDVTAMAAAANGEAVLLGTGGHTLAGVTQMEIWKGGTDWSQLVNFFLSNV